MVPSTQSLEKDGYLGMASKMQLDLHMVLPSVHVLSNVLPTVTLGCIYMFLHLRLPQLPNDA